MKRPTHKEFQLTITPGARLRCPRCGEENRLTIYDGDTIPMQEAMPDAKQVADGLALSKDGHSFYACVNAGVCRHCGTACHIVDLHIVNAPEVSRDWANTYFWLNGPVEEPHFRCTVSCRGAGMPKRWTLEITDDFVEHYCFGPFISRTGLEGSNGVANCIGGRVWKEAAAFLVRVWPLILKDVSWPESITVRGKWPPHEVAGWTPRAGKNRKDAAPA